MDTSPNYDDLPSREGRQRIGVIEAVSAPLGFFVLALLIVETFLGTVLLGASVAPADILRCIYLGVGMFLVVVGVVAGLVWAKPDHLTFGRSEHLSRILARLERRQKADEAIRDALFLRLQKRYVEAISSYEKALAHDSDSEEALIGIAVARSYLYPDDLDDSIRRLDEIIKKHPRSERAYYNRACLRCLKKADKKLWLGDLKKAIEFYPQYRDFAKYDDDFKDWLEDQDFKKTVSY